MTVRRSSGAADDELGGRHVGLAAAWLGRVDELQQAPGRAAPDLGQRRNRLGVLQAGVTISIVPCVLFYILLQCYYVSGLTSGAVK